MDSIPPGPGNAFPPFVLSAPLEQTLPLVCASPHSGREYPPGFLSHCALDRQALRRSEDSFVDEIFAAAPGLGAPLLCALFPRVYVDANREPYELDPLMFEDELPAYANTRSPRVAAGLGTIARVVAGGDDIYARKLRVGDALARIEACYRPYHAALSGLVEATTMRFGCSILLDCHSMPSATGPSAGGPADTDGGRATADFVLGDCFGSACAPVVVETVETRLRAKGYRVVRNAPYAGGYTTRHYGRPQDGLHALQIEINRALYMDERALERTAYLPTLARDMREVLKELGRLTIRQLADR
ncbi:MAG: N-formylglutamate amidohydrolase [Proteobacteria bacterium]|nr:N-formylglutamate amidohydrolase [Pseudomonadota bacterium]